MDQVPRRVGSRSGATAAGSGRGATEVERLERFATEVAAPVVPRPGWRRRTAGADVGTAGPCRPGVDGGGRVVLGDGMGAGS